MQELTELARAPGLLVVDKPAGVDVTPPRRGGLSVEGLLAARIGAGGPPRAVHRLDRDTSGCLAVALRASVHRALAAAFAAGAVGKDYLAVVAPAPEADQGVVRLPLAKRSSARSGWRMEPAAGGQPAETRWRVLALQGHSALLLLTPVTGRTHQLRVHARALAEGAAIVGDPLYGRGERGGLMLHAFRLDLPFGGGRLCVSAPCPARFPDWARIAAGQMREMPGSSDAIMAAAIRSGSMA